MNPSRPTLHYPLFGILSFVLVSCTPYYYMPNMHQVPLLRTKGEARIAYAGSSETMSVWSEVHGAELQASAAVSDKIGVLVNGAVFTSPWSEGRGRLIEAGAGRFAALGPHWTAEGYAGIGRGEVTYERERTALWRLFAQPSLGYASRNFDFAVTTRFCYLDLDDPQFNPGYSTGTNEATAAQHSIVDYC